MKTLSLTPAYCRDYQSKAAVMQAWNDNLDFKIGTSGPYVNKLQVPDLLKDGYDSVQFHYRNLRLTFILKLEK